MDIETYRSYLSLLIKEFFHNSTNLIEEQRIQLSGHFLSNQFFNMLLHLWAEFLIVANQQTKQLTDEPENDKFVDQELSENENENPLRNRAILNVQLSAWSD